MVFAGLESHLREDGAKVFSGFMNGFSSLWILTGLARHFLKMTFLQLSIVHFYLPLG